VTAVVAVDGPSGAGKSSVSRGVARALGLQYLDTGAMYRAMTWAALRDGIDLTDADAVARTSATVRLSWSCDPDESVIEVDGLDVSRAIREESVTSTVSLVAAEPRTRAVLVELQRGAVADSLAQGQGIVVEGRDIGSVVLPDADLKVWLVADPAVRAARRAAEDVAAGRLPGVSADAEAAGASTDIAAPDVDVVAADLARRDAADAGRTASPTTRAADAVLVDATDLGLAEVIARVVQLVHERTSP
jgi:cytidylate kinase